MATIENMREMLRMKRLSDAYIDTTLKAGFEPALGANTFLFEGCCLRMALDEWDRQVNLARDRFMILWSGGFND